MTEEEIKDIEKQIEETSYLLKQIEYCVDQPLNFIKLKEKIGE